MGFVSVKTSGLTALYAKLDNNRTQAPVKAKRAMQRTLQTAQSKAQSLARVKTGYMRQNIQPTSITVTGWGVTGVLTSSAEYSSFNEYGTFKMSAQPFMLPAQRIAEVKMKQFMTESLKGGFA